ncbi:Mak10 subunit, NatC N-terminal acetyltransferase-domain-containing protein [Dichotomocladium elegans]|nr:Mak10 subunit, NatC N-terminal acetyltransferase-domain-containing protein [Dichotomocladium elegans]
MDPKMDTGMALPNTTTYDISQPLNWQQVLWVMDRLLSCEMGWLSGHSLSQTVYTCIYFHHLRTLATEDDRHGQDKYRAALKAYLLASVKCCYFIWVEMTACNVYEEEDFTTNLFGLSLYEDISEAMILNMLDVAIFQLQNEKDESEAKPILKRLIARKSYLLALIYLSEAQCQRLPEARIELKKLQDLLIQDTTDLSIRRTVELGTPVDGAFDPSINRKLMSQAPPRPITLQSNKDGYDSYVQLIERLLSICNVTNYPYVGSLMLLDA